jgi:hypothetical protein
MKQSVGHDSGLCLFCYGPQAWVDAVRRSVRVPKLSAAFYTPCLCPRQNPEAAACLPQWHRHNMACRSCHAQWSRGMGYVISNNNSTRTAYDC